MRLLIVGFMRSGHLGAYLSFAARQLKIDYQSIDAELAEARNRIAQSFYWRLRGKRPAHLGRFGREVIAACEIYRPDIVITTGRSPLSVRHIAAIQNLGAKVVNYSTDDPWNSVQKSSWFVTTLPAYDVVFTPRRANLSQFCEIGVRRLHYLPFAYDPEIHKAWPRESAPGPESDLLFVGGCDADRLSIMRDLIQAGFDLALFGGYWDRHAETRPYARGISEQDVIRAASASARLSLCLVRRANRDEHVMRSYEAAAIGGCILAEDTEDHRNLFGDAVSYFRNPDELIEQAQMLLNDPDMRDLLADRLRARLRDTSETYASRLSEILDITLRAKPFRIVQKDSSSQESSALPAFSVNPAEGRTPTSR
jgi:spore maturation protein CgeB